MEEDKIKYSDIIQPDDSLEKLITQLGEINRQYETMTNAIRAGADRIVYALKKASGATSEGRKSIEEATEATSRLERAQRELDLAMSETGQEIARLKAKTREANSATVEQMRYMKQAESSYDKLKSDLKQSVTLFNSLTAAERADAEMGQKLIADILGLKDAIKSVGEQIKPQIEQLTRLQKAEQELAYWQSAEGQQLLDVKAKIAEVTSARKQQKTAVDPLEKAQKKLAYANSEEYRQLVLANKEAKEAEKMARLVAIAKKAEEGSYEHMAAQYAINTMRLNKMGPDQRKVADETENLTEKTLLLYKQMIQLQEATGNHRFSVGNYRKAWNGVYFSVQQIVRELPTAVVSLNHLFLAVSNNIPILIDEVKRLNEQNKTAIANGDKAKSVLKTITGALFNWQTLLIAGLTILATHGEAIVDWIGNLLSGKKAVMSTKEAMKALNEELANTNSNYGENVVTFRKLKNEWDDLSEREKIKYTKKYADALKDLGIKATTVAEIEQAFNKRTGDILTAFKLRAQAAAAKSLAMKKYGEAFQLEQELEQKKDAGPDFWDKLIATLATSATSATRFGLTGPVLSPYAKSLVPETISAEEVSNFFIKQLEDKRQETKEAADKFYEMFEQFEKEAADKLGNLFDDGEGSGDSKKQPKDLSDKIAKDRLKIRKKYEASVTRLIEDEIEQRKAEAADSRRAETRELILQLANNERLLKANETAKNGIFEMGGKKYKQLTEDQVNVIKEQQKLINETILKNNEFIAKENEKFALEKQKRQLEIEQETINLQLEAVKEGSEEELKLRLQALENERKQALLANKLLPETQRQSEDDINSSFTAEQLRLLGDFELKAFESVQKRKKAEFNTVKHLSEEITAFEIQQEIDLWNTKISLAEQGMSEWSKKQIAEAKAYVKELQEELDEAEKELSFIGRLGKYGPAGALLSYLGFKEEGIEAFNDATNTIISNLQSIMEAEVQLAEAAVEAAQERADSAKSALDAEIEARNKGYANNVASARKEYELEKKRVADNQKLLQQAQRRQEALDTAMQTSSLITASANIWKAMSGVAFIGPALALAAIAGMWTSFAASKVKARQVTAAEQEYGEGGLEFLEGGSHASGHDISLGTKNSRGKNMRAEGGEALAIINKRNTKRYRKQLPGIIESLNKGTFEDKYLRAFDTGSQLSLRVEPNRVDLSKIEGYVEKISNQETTQRVALPDGTMLVVRKNVRRIIKSC